MVPIKEKKNQKLQNLHDLLANIREDCIRHQTKLSLQQHLYS